MRIPFVLALAFLTLFVSGCDRAGSDNASTPVAGSEPAAAAATPDAKSGLWFKPEAISSCETAALVRVYWDVSADKAVKAVKVLTVRENGEEAVFAGRASPKDVKRTGKWIRAGREFVVRDAGSGAELARAAVGTLPCPEGAGAQMP
ncbi:hypothetical protein [Luteimonas mephitis]|uniref:hypothetical protein n=1 Tax=Luteimonas mephitis TaxID=83615 RepID=UPI00047DFB74|nr:hypothetical protein [Luteimonas mephitis]